MIPIRFGLTAALGAKALVGGAVVALAAGAAGAVATHSANPMSWGQQVVQAVEQCKAAGGNVGRCVSAIAQEHGEQVRAQHSEAAENASPSPKPGQREGQENGQSQKAGGNGAAAPGSQGQSQSQAHDGGQAGAASHDDHGHGRPSPHP